LESISGLKELFLNDIELPSIDLTPLGKHSALELLDLANSGLQQIDLSPLSGTSLRELRLEKNDLEELDLEGIPKSIQRLNINDNRLKHINLAPLRGSAIETIELNLNKLEQIDLQPLLSCDNLRKVSLWGNSIRSIVKLIIQIESKRIPDYPFYVEVHGDEEIYPTFYSKVRKSRYY
jgi:Leucine-rich repeat (LRR) protein